MDTSLHIRVLCQLFAALIQVGSKEAVEVTDKRHYWSGAKGRRHVGCSRANNHRVTRKVCSEVP